MGYNREKLKTPIPHKSDNANNFLNLLIRNYIFYKLSHTSTTIQNATYISSLY